eukprot:2291044-Pyramimonas_sp.AAC.1
MTSIVFFFPPLPRPLPCTPASSAGSRRPGPQPLTVKIGLRESLVGWAPCMASSALETIPNAWAASRGPRQGSKCCLFGCCAVGGDEIP